MNQRDTINTLLPDHNPLTLTLVSATYSPLTDSIDQDQTE